MTNAGISRGACGGMKAEMPAGDPSMAAFRVPPPVTVGGAAAAGTVTIGRDGGLVVNRMGFGAMRITGPGAWGPPPDRTRSVMALRVAVDAGVNFIDTADSYGPGVSEEIIAEALFPYPDGLVLATKGGLARPGPDQWVPDGRPERLRECCEGSLRRLRLEQIPLYQLHRPDPAVPLAESVGALAELQREGKIRHIGVSNVSQEQLRAIRGLGVEVASVQNRYNAADRGSEEIVDLCEADGMVFLPWAPMHEAARLAPMAEAARRLGTAPEQVALAWLLGRSPQILVIPGSGSLEHVAANINAATLPLALRRRAPRVRSEASEPTEAAALAFAPAPKL